MDDEVRDPSTVEWIRSSLVDVSALPLTLVMALDESVLGNALRRLAAEIHDDSEVIAGWGEGVE